MIRIAIISGIVALFTTAALAENPRSLDPGHLPDDARLGDLNHLDGTFPFTQVPDAKAWQARADQLRRQTKIAAGLWPEPTKTPLNAVVHGKVERDDFTVERVFFESIPGHYVTGSLFRPKIGSGPRPVVLSPHGHWANGRFYVDSEGGVKQKIENGAETFADCGRYPLQARCIQLARMGCVVFHYDMIGYADSRQFSEHRPGVREAMNTMENWGLFSPQAELRMQSLFGLQTWNSVRALDFVLTLPDVDPKRVGVTGGSGGGTQTFMLCAVDDRVTVGVPAVMVSTAMQGGCTCENSCYLRVKAGNIDLAGLMAPKPLGLIAADDWTKELMTKGYPDLEKLYAMLGAKDRLAASANLQFGHNYNQVSRTFMYGWFNQHFNLGFDGPIKERHFKPLSKAELTVWNDEHPLPEGGDDHERAIAKWMTKDARLQLDRLSLEGDSFRKVVGGAWDTLLGRTMDQVGDASFSLRLNEERHGARLLMTLVNNTTHNEQVPVGFWYPLEDWNERVILLLSPTGKDTIFNGNGAPSAEAQAWLDKKYAVGSADLLYQGEFLKDGGAIEKTRLKIYRDGKSPWQHYAGYTFGYNHAVFAHRVHDVLSVVKAIQSDKRKPKSIELHAGPGTAPIALAARYLAGEEITKASIDMGDFRFAQVNRFDDPNYLPGAAKYGDVPALVALCAPHALEMK